MAHRGLITVAGDVTLPAIPIRKEKRPDQDVALCNGRSAVAPGPNGSQRQWDPITARSHCRSEVGIGMPDDLRTVRLCVEAAITSEQTKAGMMARAADELGDHPLACHLRSIAREHRVVALTFQTRLDAILSTDGEPTGRE